MPTDDLGMPFTPHGAVRRVVSLVPSLTESLAETAPELLVGATDWCTHPEGLTVRRLRGTKNPDVAAIIDLRPDLVLANEEENRRVDIEALRSAGVPVWVTRIRTLDEAFASLRRMFASACGVPEPAWLDAAERAWSAVPPVTVVRQGLIPIWRKPWMVLGRDTFAGDVLLRLGVRNVYADHPERYPKVALPELLAAGADLVVLPDEPYRFTAEDGPGFFPATPAALVSGRHLTWYGPSLVEAPAALLAALGR
ncbi:helical backbone metal receptor [Sphaerimonospora thailandensis]|uniref:ABC transporter substrate-binding protein n=1 Tax=Sphaerimonospora thailandensis TaxID=795644 RepID=A0A8J3RAQ3_9ACTN|nr:helical backbone metal receptor [Sphaerimonospora thailandensis]GIH72551.1 ABC transporter substrate-binding protein [Sphaerimonospora thailandensis]